MPSLYRKCSFRVFFGKFPGPTSSRRPRVYSHAPVCPTPRGIYPVHSTIFLLTPVFPWVPPLFPKSMPTCVRRHPTVCARWGSSTCTPPSHRARAQKNVRYVQHQRASFVGTTVNNSQSSRAAITSRPFVSPRSFLPPPHATHKHTLFARNNAVWDTRH